MGCGESKIKSIHITPEGLGDDMVDKVNKQEAVATISNGNEDDLLPNRLLAAIPVSDLGDSLDSRHLEESLNLSHSMNGLKRSGASGVKAPDSAESADSGYDDYDEEYSHIITENSEPEKVKQVESDFRGVELPELLVITGRACTRILSGYQKNKQEEAKILDTLRSEGLLAQPKGKTSGGVSFEVLDASIVQNNPNPDSDDLAATTTTFVSANFIPKRKLEKLEERRTTIRHQSANIEARLAEAEERRKAMESEKVKMVLERSGLEKHGRMRSASAMRRENKFSATVAKRQQHLQEMRDKLKEKHKKNDMVRLKQQLLSDSLNSDRGLDYGSTGFFDD